MSKGSAAAPQHPLLKMNQPSLCFPPWGLSSQSASSQTKYLPRLHYLIHCLTHPACAATVHAFTLSPGHQECPSTSALPRAAKSPPGSCCAAHPIPVPHIPSRSAADTRHHRPGKKNTLLYPQKRQSRAEPRGHGQRTIPRRSSGARCCGGEGGRAAGRGSGRGGLVGVVHVVHVALLVLRHLRQSPLSPPGRAAGRQRHLVPPTPLPLPPRSPPSKCRPRSSSRPQRPPRWAASGCPLRGGGQGGGHGGIRDAPAKGANAALARRTAPSPLDESGTWMPLFQHPPLSVLPSGLPTMAPPANAISRDTTMPAAWKPPWMLGVRVWYTPVKSNALMNLPRAEMVMIAPGRRNSPVPEEPWCPVLLGALP